MWCIVLAKAESPKKSKAKAGKVTSMYYFSLLYASFCLCDVQVYNTSIYNVMWIILDDL